MNQDLDRLIHEPGRLQIVALLSVVESADATFLQRQTGLTWGNLSSHLAKLEGGGYITVNKTFVHRKPCTLLALTPEGRQAFEAYRSCMLGIINPPG